MQIEQTRWSPGKGWLGSPACLKQTAWQADIEQAYSNAHCQTMPMTTVSEF